MGSAAFFTTQLAHAQVGVGVERDAAEQRRALERETQLREQQDQEEPDRNRTGGDPPGDGLDMQ